MNAEQFYNFCKKHHACASGLAAIKGITLREWWQSTDRADWMVWLMGKTETVGTPLYIRLAIHFAESVLHKVRAVDREVCETAIRAAKDYLANPTETNRKKAADAADAAADAEHAAAYAAADAAYAAADAEHAAAYAAADAVHAALRAAKADETVAKPNADYVRSLVSYEDILQAITAPTGKEENDEQ